MASNSDKDKGKCPVVHTGTEMRPNREWWPDQLNLHILRQNGCKVDPMGCALQTRGRRAQTKDRTPRTRTSVPIEPR